VRKWRENKTSTWNPIPHSEDMDVKTMVKTATLVLLVNIFFYSFLPILALLTPRTAASFATKVSPSSSSTMLTPRTPADVQLEIKDPVDPTALAQSRAILAELRPSSDHSSSSLSSSSCNPKALLSIAKRLGDIADENASYIVSKQKCQEAFTNLSPNEKQTLSNIHQRVKVFAEAQRKSVGDVCIDIPGGKAGHTVSPCRGTYFSLSFATCTCFCFVFLTFWVPRC